MPVVFRFALEQGQIQKELLKELDIPYALLDTDGKILWGNAKFIEEIGVGSKKRIRKNISAFFPAVDAEALSSEEMQMVVMIGHTDTVAIWDKAAWDKINSPEEIDLKEIAEIGELFNI